MASTANATQDSDNIFDLEDIVELTEIVQSKPSKKTEDSTEESEDDFALNELLSQLDDENDEGNQDLVEALAKKSAEFNSTLDSNQQTQNTNASRSFDALDDDLDALLDGDTTKEENPLDLDAELSALLDLDDENDNDKELDIDDLDSLLNNNTADDSTEKQEINTGASSQDDVDSLDDLDSLFEEKATQNTDSTNSFDDLDSLLNESSENNTTDSFDALDDLDALLAAENDTVELSSSTKEALKEEEKTEIAAEILETEQESTDTEFDELDALFGELEEDLNPTQNEEEVLAKPTKAKSKEEEEEDNYLELMNSLDLATLEHEEELKESEESSEAIEEANKTTEIAEEFGTSNLDSAIEQDSSKDLDSLDQDLDSFDIDALLAENAEPETISQEPEPTEEKVEEKSSADNADDIDSLIENIENSNQNIIEDFDIFDQEQSSQEDDASFIEKEAQNMQEMQVGDTEVLNGLNEDANSAEITAKINKAKLEDTESLTEFSEKLSQEISNDISEIAQSDEISEQSAELSQEISIDDLMHEFEKSENSENNVPNKEQDAPQKKQTSIVVTATKTIVSSKKKNESRSDISATTQEAKTKRENVDKEKAEPAVEIAAEALDITYYQAQLDMLFSSFSTLNDEVKLLKESNIEVLQANQASKSQAQKIEFENNLKSELSGVKNEINALRLEAGKLKDIAESISAMPAQESESDNTFTSSAISIEELNANFASNDELNAIKDEISEVKERLEKLSASLLAYEENANTIKNNLQENTIKQEKNDEQYESITAEVARIDENYNEILAEIQKLSEVAKTETAIPAEAEQTIQVEENNAKYDEIKEEFDKISSSLITHENVQKLKDDFTRTEESIQLKINNFIMDCVERFDSFAHELNNPFADLKEVDEKAIPAEIIEDKALEKQTIDINSLDLEELKDALFEKIEAKLESKISLAAAQVIREELLAVLKEEFANEEDINSEEENREFSEEAHEENINEENINEESISEENLFDFENQSTLEDENTSETHIDVEQNLEQETMQAVNESNSLNELSENYFTEEFTFDSMQEINDETQEVNIEITEESAGMLEEAFAENLTETEIASKQSDEISEIDDLLEGSSNQSSAQNLEENSEENSNIELDLDFDTITLSKEMQVSNDQTEEILEAENEKTQEKKPEVTISIDDIMADIDTTK